MKITQVNAEETEGQDVQRLEQYLMSLGVSGVHELLRNPDVHFDEGSRESDSLLKCPECSSFESNKIELVCGLWLLPRRIKSCTRK